MSISERDIKRLWGRAAGRCSEPSCGRDCAPYLDGDTPSVIGDMAHVVARNSAGPRGDDLDGPDTYENLVLLCPTHHRMVDAAPRKFTVEVLLGWKGDHERRVENALQSPLFNTWAELADFVQKKLLENKACWASYGPECLAAKRNANSNLGRLWPFRKLATIVPNNRLISLIIQQNSKLFTAGHYRIASIFVEHAAGFESNCYGILEDVPQFPREFEDLFG